MQNEIGGQKVEITVDVWFNMHDDIVKQDPCVCVEYAGAQLYTGTRVGVNRPSFPEPLGHITLVNGCREISVSVLNRRTRNPFPHHHPARFPVDIVLQDGIYEPALQLVYTNDREGLLRDAGQIRIKMKYLKPKGGDAKHAPTTSAGVVEKAKK